MLLETGMRLKRRDEAQQKEKGVQETVAEKSLVLAINTAIQAGKAWVTRSPRKSRVARQKQT